MTIEGEKLLNLFIQREMLKDEIVRFMHEHEINGEITEEEADLIDARIEKELEPLTKEIKNELRRPVNKPRGIWEQPGAGFGDGGDISRPSIASKGYQTSKNYCQNFVNAVRTNFQDGRILDFLQEGFDSSGGFLLPTEMHHELIEKLTQENILRQICTVIQTQATHKIDIVSSAPTASWVSEGADIPVTDAEFKKVQLEAYKLAVATKISRELLQDAYYPLEEFLADSFARAISLQEEETFLNGDGQGKPLGLLPTLAQSASSTLQTTGTEISPDDLITLIYSLDRPYRAKACFLLSDSTLAAIRRLKDATQNFLWTPNFGEEPAKLCGFPIYTSAFLPPPSKGNTCVIFGDFSRFIIGNRGEMTFQPLRELFALKDINAYLLTARVDCVLADTHAIRALRIRA